MTKDEINRAIAQAAGWHVAQSPFERHGIQCSAPGGVWWHESVSGCQLIPPNYHDSLDAMHEAEKLLNSTLETWGYYWDKVCLVTGACPFDKDISDDCRSVLNATAAQRAEAFLRCLGKWEGGGV